MATLAFAYTGRDATGKIVKGRLEAPTEAATASRLRTMGVSPIEIKESDPATGLGREISIPGLGGKRIGLKARLNESSLPAPKITVAGEQPAPKDRAQLEYFGRAPIRLRVAHQDLLDVLRVAEQEDRPAGNPQVDPVAVLFQ